MRKLAVLAMILVCALSPAAQAPPPAKARVAKSLAPAQPPTVEQILERYVTAIGGREAYKRVTSRTYRGTVKMKMGPDELPDGKVEIFTKAPDRLRMNFDIKGILIEEGFDGHTAWEFNSVDGGVRLRRGERAAKARIEAQFHSETQLAELFPQTRYIGEGSANSVRTHMVEAVSEEGLKRVYHFSVATGLVIRMEDEVKESGRIERHITDLKDYRTFGGVRIPMLMTLRSPDIDVIITFSEVQQNVHIDEARFKRPKAEPR